MNEYQLRQEQDRISQIYSPKRLSDELDSANRNIDLWQEIQTLIKVQQARASITPLRPYVKCSKNNYSGHVRYYLNVMLVPIIDGVFKKELAYNPYDKYRDQWDWNSSFSHPERKALFMGHVYPICSALLEDYPDQPVVFGCDFTLSKKEAVFFEGWSEKLAYKHGTLRYLFTGEDNIPGVEA